MQDFTQVVAKLDELELEKKQNQNARSSGGQPVGGGAGLLSMIENVQSAGQLAMLQANSMFSVKEF